MSGEFKGRREDDRLLAGRGKYTADDVSVSTQGMALMLANDVGGGFGIRSQAYPKYAVLMPLGIHHLDFPFTPARVWSAICKAQA